MAQQRPRLRPRSPMRRSAFQSNTFLPASCQSRPAAPSPLLVTQTTTPPSRLAARVVPSLFHSMASAAARYTCRQSHIQEHPLYPAFSRYRIHIAEAPIRVPSRQAAACARARRPTALVHLTLSPPASRQSRPSPRAWRDRRQKYLHRPSLYTSRASYRGRPVRRISRSRRRRRRPTAAIVGVTMATRRTVATTSHRKRQRRTTAMRMSSSGMVQTTRRIR